MNKKTLFITTRGFIQLNDSLEPVGYDTDRSAISNVVRIKEPLHIVYNRRDDVRIELEAEPGDILVEFYEGVFPNPIVLVHSKEWSENIDKYEEAQQAAKEKWAAAKCQGEVSCGDSAC